jgi:ABC-type antimicrobial peptide transport system permease subunit
MVYVPYAQLDDNHPTTVVARVSGTIGRLGPAIERTLRARLPGTPIAVRPLTAQVSATLVRERMMATLAGAFGLLALTLACVGLYGLLAYGVAQRVREIGIRMALGAPGSRVVALVLGRGVRLVTIGIAIGLPAAWLGARAIESMLFGLSRTDPISLGGAAVLLLSAAQLAAFLPARRAARIDPITALRRE